MARAEFLTSNSPDWLVADHDTAVEIIDRETGINIGGQDVVPYELGVLALVDNSVVGACYLDPHNSQNDRYKSIIMPFIAITHALQRQRIGGQLLASAEAIGREAGFCTIRAHSMSESSRRLFISRCYKLEDHWFTKPT